MDEVFLIFLRFIVRYLVKYHFYCFLKLKHMILTVVKRDGRIVGFNREKIAAAIRKAMLTTENGEDEVLVYKIVDRIEIRGKEQS